MIAWSVTQTQESARRRQLHKIQSSIPRGACGRKRPGGSAMHTTQYEITPDSHIDDNKGSRDPELLVHGDAAQCGRRGTGPDR